VSSQPVEFRHLLHTLASKTPYMSPALRAVSDVVLADPEAAQAMSITDLAHAAGVAESTVSRFVREIGLDSYNALRLGIAEAVYSGRGAATAAGVEGYVYEGVLRGDSVPEAVAKVLVSSRQALERTSAVLNHDAVARVVSRIHEARSIYFVAMGSSAVAAENAVVRFVRAGKRCILFRDQGLQVMTAATLDHADLVIGFSDSGASVSVVESLRIARQHGAFTVGVTATEKSPVTLVCDEVLFTASPLADAGVYGESVTAKWGQLLVADALYASYAAAHYDATIGFLEETYLSGIKDTRTS
jgi:DNA-binding MurR/RpiR family transcriptional regulator